MELESLFGLPAHPLVVHAAVVLLPLAAIATVLTAAIPRARRHYAPLALGLALVATLAIWLAESSGESLEERVDESELVEEHTEHAEQVLPWAVGLTVAAAAVTAAPYVSGRRPALTPTRVTAVLVVAATITGLGATVTVIDVGHSGAKATWDDLPVEQDG